MQENIISDKLSDNFTDKFFMSDKFKDECGVFGIWNNSEAAKLTYLGLYAMQHRGQESAGIVSCCSGQHFTYKQLGLVCDAFNEDQIEMLKGNSSIGHVRYATTGDNLISNAQPLTANLLNGPVAIAHNGNIVNAAELKTQLQKEGSIFQGSNDTEVLLHLLSRNTSNNLVTALSDSLKFIEGAYSLVILSHDQLIAVRDPFGFRPLVLGKMMNSKSYVVVSETCALDLIGAEFVREILPGEIVQINDEGIHSYIFSKKPNLAQCVFEHVYFSRPDSIVFGQSVYQSRRRFGEQLALQESFNFSKEDSFSNVINDTIVVPVPDSGVPAALGYSQKSGIPFELGIIRNHYIGRTFIQPHQSGRDLGVKIKLNPQSSVLKNKKVILIDDSLVRGTTSQKIIQLIRQAGALEVHLKIASPPTIGPCFYGVDTPQKSELIASKNSIEQIREFIGADSLTYLSEEGLWKAMQSGPEKFCAACFNGKYPTKFKGEIT